MSEININNSDITNETDTSLIVCRTNEIEGFSVMNNNTPVESKGGIFDCINFCLGLCKKQKKDSLLLNK